METREQREEFMTALRSHVTDRISRDRAAELGRTVSAQDKITIFRTIVQQMTLDQLTAAADPKWQHAPAAPQSNGASELQVVEWLAKHRPTIGAGERLREVRRLTGTVLPDLGAFVDPGEHARLREERRAENMRRSLQELAERRAKP